MGILGFGRGAEKHLIVVTYEGGGRLRLNGIRAKDKKTKQNAMGHGQTVCWSEFDADGVRTDQGIGPESGRLDGDKLERLIRELPATPECRAVLELLKKGDERASKWLAWGNTGAATRGTAGDRGRK